MRRRASGGRVGRAVTTVVISAGLILFAIPSAAAAHPGGRSDPKPTIVLVHGAFADSSGFAAVIRRLRADGFPVVAAANPLRTLTSDAAQVASLLDSIEGPVVLVGHSYGGSVISAAVHQSEVGP